MSSKVNTIGRTQPTTFGPKDYTPDPTKGFRDSDEQHTEDALPPYETPAEMEQFVPIKNQVLVQDISPEDNEPVLEGILYIPKMAQHKKQHTYKVISCGPDAKAVNPGDIVLLPMGAKRGSIVVCPCQSCGIRLISDRIFWGKEKKEAFVIREWYILGVVEE